MRGVRRLSVTACGLLASGAALVAPVHAAHAASGTTCEMQAVVEIDPPGMSLTAGAFTYDVAGELSSSLGGSVPACGSTIPAAPAGTPSIDAGRAAIVRISGTDASGPWSVDYALPQATGAGTCGLSTTSGVFLAQWPDGTDTVIDYATVGVGSAWVLGGRVADRAKLHEVASSGTPPATTPTTYTVTSNNPAFPEGTGVAGEFAFINEIGDPTCSATTFGGLTGALQLGGA